MRYDQFFSYCFSFSQVQASAGPSTTDTTAAAFRRIHLHLDKLSQQVTKLSQQPGLISSDLFSSNIKEKARLFNTASPLVKMPKLFESQYDISPERMILGATSATTHHLSLKETRKAEVVFGFTTRLSHFIFEAIRLEDNFHQLAGLERLPWPCQEFYLAKLLKPFMNIRSIAGVTKFLEAKCGKDSTISKGSFDLWAQFQLSKMSHSFEDEGGAAFRATVNESIFHLGDDPEFLANEFFPALPVLPANEKMWEAITYNRQNSSFMETMAFLTWISCHDQILRRAMTAPLFENGHYSHVGLLATRPSTICFSPDAAVMASPKCVRVLRVMTTLIASKIVRFSITKRFPRNANPQCQVFLPMSIRATKSQGIADDLLANPDKIRFTGWTSDKEWMKHFETQAKIDRSHSCNIFNFSNLDIRYYNSLTSLKICSLFHESKPSNCTSPTWESIRPIRALTMAHSHVLDLMDFMESFLRKDNPLAFHESIFNQIVPCRSLFWLKSVKYL